MRYQFLVDTYRTEIDKVVSVWAMFDDADLPVRPHSIDPRGRSVLEQMVHQSVSEHLWFSTMLGISVTDNPGPGTETRQAFMHHYADHANRRLVGHDRAVLRSVAIARLDHDPSHRAHRAPPRPADGAAADAQPRPAQQLRSHRRHGRPDATPGPGDLRLSGPRHPPAGRGRPARQDPAAGTWRTTIDGTPRLGFPL